MKAHLEKFIYTLRRMRERGEIVNGVESIKKIQSICLNCLAIRFTGKSKKKMFIFSHRRSERERNLMII